MDSEPESRDSAVRGRRAPFQATPHDTQSVPKRPPLNAARRAKVGPCILVGGPCAGIILLTFPITKLGEQRPERSRDSGAEKEAVQMCPLLGARDPSSSVTYGARCRHLETPLLGGMGQRASLPCPRY
jgi:hypothetical protein